MGQVRAAPLEGVGQRLSQKRAVERKLSRQGLNIVEILHPAVRNSQAHERLEFLCDHTLARVR